MGKFSTIEEALEDLKNGHPIVVADDEDRENEGDLVVASEFAGHEWVNFMARECRGLICLCITPERARELDLAPMVRRNTDVKKTAFTQSIDADTKFGVTTGISAYDRARTIEIVLSQETKPEDLRRPGHVFPLVAQTGGVLKRVGHTEAGVDLARLSGLYPSAVICEIMNEDGTMMRRDNLFKFCKKHKFKFITIEQLIAYRLKTERSVKRVVKTNLPTKFGKFEIYGYLDTLTNVEHVALVKKDDAANKKTPLVRMHSECLTGDIFQSLKCDCSQQLQQSLKMIEDYGTGALVYLRDHEGRGIGLLNKLKAYILQEKGKDTVEANEALGFESDLRDYGTGAQILLDIGYEEFKLITNNPKKIIALSGYGLKVTERAGFDADINAFNKKYLKTKKEKMKHLYKNI
ncbi:3,4-dihydroxy 2-butanone 4-phosphate synthase / GTP cyclohydrolase II [Candidatus Gastranaerophilus sp. (ex Termes propinquus)]|nr:3,4-dihydroxy 2-butanone 4-phosphate synthase / GTP cyclohydrolase II [Candidatus Gastranaerophilus sp. (ex Termes propinquus)]